MTKMTYATKEAFKILREKFYQSEEEKMSQRIQALNELLSLKKDKHKRHKAVRTDDGEGENVPVSVQMQVRPAGNKRRAEAVVVAVRPAPPVSAPASVVPAAPVLVPSNGPVVEPVGNQQEHP